MFDRGGKVFNRSAPIIKLRPDATEDDHYQLLGVLNSSTACFWMKQVFQAKAAGGIGRGLEAEPFMERYEHDATKLKQFPLPANLQSVIPYARAIDALAQQRTTRSLPALLADAALWSNAGTLRQALTARRVSDTDDLYRMIALQEELDWLCYRLYGLLDDEPVVPPDEVVPCPPTWLPWCVTHAIRDAEIRQAIANGEDPGDLPTAWFERHRWEPCTDLPSEAPDSLKARVARRRELATTHAEIGLIESATYKRRWYRPDYDAEEREALRTWLADQMESIAKTRTTAFTLEWLTSVLQSDPRVLAVAEVLTGRPDFSLADLVQDILPHDSVPNHPVHRYSPSGLVKRAAWEQTWEDQRREDAGENVTPEVPPSYSTPDFLRNEYWQLRGKLDVPKERFIAFTEVPDRTDTLYGWAGWTPLQRLKALLSIDEDLEDAGVPLAKRIGVLDSAWRLLPDVARDDPAAANRLKAELQALVGPDGPSKEMLEAWRELVPPPGTRIARPKKTTKAATGRKSKSKVEA